jgi:hypothetical protein
MSLVTDEYVGLVEDLARIQAETNTPFPMPNGIDAEDVAAAHRLIRLLDGEAIEIQPAERQFAMQEPQAKPPPKGDKTIFGYEASVTMPLMGEEIPVGVCVLSMWPGTFELIHDGVGGRSVRVIPHADSRATLRRGSASGNPPSTS